MLQTYKLHWLHLTQRKCPFCHQHQQKRSFQMTPGLLDPHARTLGRIENIWRECYPEMEHSVHIWQIASCKCDYEFNMAISYIMQLLTQDYGIWGNKKYVVQVKRKNKNCLFSLSLHPQNQEHTWLSFQHGFAHPLSSLAWLCPGVPWPGKRFDWSLQYLSYRSHQQTTPTDSWTIQLHHGPVAETSSRFSYPYPHSIVFNPSLTWKD